MWVWHAHVSATCTPTHTAPTQMCLPHPHKCAYHAHTHVLTHMYRVPPPPPTHTHTHTACKHRRHQATPTDANLVHLVIAVLEHLQEEGPHLHWGLVLPSPHPRHTGVQLLLDEVAGHVREVIVAHNGRVRGSAKQPVVDANEERGGATRAGCVREHLRSLVMRSLVMRSLVTVSLLMRWQRWKKKKAHFSRV